jgi:LemA protein
MRQSFPFLLRSPAYRRQGLISLIAFSAFAFFVSGCGLRSIPQAKNDVDAANAEIMSQYQRRADLVPNLVNVVRGAASSEKDILESVVNARARATSLNVTTDDPQSLRRFQEAQGELSQALGRLLAVTENYPDLKSNQGFRDLQVQLEGTENRIAVARTRAIDSIRRFNDLVTVFPTNLTNSIVYHHQPLPQYGADKDVRSLEQAPKVEFAPQGN